MKKPQSIPTLQAIATPIILCMVFFMITGRADGREASQDLNGKAIHNITRERASQQAPDQPYDVYLPILNRLESPPMATLTSASTSDLNGNEQTLFLPGDTMRFTAGGRNNYPTNITVTLRWEQENPCGTTQIISETLSLPPGDWQRTTTSTIPSCPGIYTTTARVSNNVQTVSLAVLDMVNPPSIVETNNQQGFDRCHLSSVPQMNTWWNSSPYWVYNIYLGGSMFYCDDEIPDAFWVHQVAGQGWKFILTWVGPQAPCSVFRVKMSSVTSTARQQGRTEASAAADAASRMGFMGNRVIYYDLEAYGSSASSECRAAVSAFMRGWTERLHELGYMAGGYGSPATSHVADWAANSPPPDYIWIAHWLTPAQYRADATVWSPYLSDNLWIYHQRIRQYAGGHNETWGGVTLDMDSNVLDGAVTTIPLGLGVAEAPTPVKPLAEIPAIRQMQLLSHEGGYVLQGERLLVTQDGGRSWQNITPPGSGDESILGAQMLNQQQGWIVRQGATVDELMILQTKDGGASWKASRLQLAPSQLDGSPVAEASLDFINENTGWLALQLQSGSSFSLGRLFATQDGGISWEERILPLGEAVHFSDALHGWVAGGPGGDQRYRTEDGGYTWIDDGPAGTQTVAPQATLSSLPILQEASAGSTRWIVLSGGTCSGDKKAEGAAVQCYQRSSLYQSTDGGSTWSEITPLTQ